MKSNVLPYQGNRSVMAAVNAGEVPAGVIYHYYYYGDQAPNFVPHKRIDPSLGFGYDYDVVNSDAILHRLSVQIGRAHV